MHLAIAPNFRRLVLRLSCFAAAMACAASASGQAAGAEQRVTFETRCLDTAGGAIDVGPAPSSQRLSLTLTLAPSEAQNASLDQFLAAVTTPSSASYHQWLTPRQFAASYGASADKIAAATAWLQARGLSVDAVSPSGMRLSVSGSLSQIEPAFAVAVHNFQAQGHLYYANVAQPSLPPETSTLFQSIEGLDNLPQEIVQGPSAAAGTLVNGQPMALTIANLASLVETNASSMLTIDATYGVGMPPQSRVAAYRALFRQAAAQGITTLLTRTASSGGFPSTLAEVTAVARPGDMADQLVPVAARPGWQNAPGLPADGLRYAPDLTASSSSDLAQTISAIALQTGGRLGNISPTLYELGPTPGLYTQADEAAAGTWEPARGLGLVDMAKLAKAYPRGTGTSTLQIVTSANSPMHGQAFYLTVTENPTNGGSVPTGSVTFTSPQSGFNSTNGNLNSNGVLQSPNYLLPGGTYSITASYSGDANYAPATGMITITVQPEAAVFTISAPASVALGATVTATVTLSSASGVGTPNVSVTVTPSGITGATAVTQTITGTGGTASAPFTFITKQAGSVALQASCTSNDASFTCYTPQTSTTTVPQATPTVALSITPNTPTAGTPVSFQANVTGVAGIGATGTVQFFDGATAIGSGSAPGATYTGTLAPGAHTLTAVYQGDSNYAKTTSNAVSTSVGLATTTTTVNASASSASFGQNITLNITVASTTTVNGTQPTGMVTFTGAGTNTTATITGGSANVTLTGLGVGTYTITTVYSGDSNYSASNGNTVVVSITQATASLNPSISSTSFSTGSSATLTVTVTLPGNGQLAAGSAFTATILGLTGGAYTGTFTVNPGGNTGTGQVTIPAPVAGSYTLQITCGTNANFTCTPSNIAITSTATGGTTSTGTTPTATALTISPTTPAAGQPIVFTATVSAAASAVAATPLAGTVNFYSGSTLIGSGTITTVGANGVATATLTLAASTTALSLTAVYQGNTVYASSTSAAVAVTLAAAPAVVSLQSNVASTLAGTSVVLTATVTGSTTTGSAPTGTVSFYIAGATPALIGTASVGTAGNGVGVAVFSTSNLPSGSITIYATYNGDVNFSSATSNQITVGLSDYALSFTPQTLTLKAGQSGSTTAVVALINSFPGSVILGCTPPPGDQMTCSFNPAVLTGGGVTTLTVTTTVPKSQSIGTAQSASLGVVGALSVAALFGWLMPTRRRRLPTLMLTLLALGLMFNVGCGGNGNEPAATINGGTPLGTVLLVIDTSGTTGANTVRHDYTFQVTIQ